VIADHTGLQRLIHFHHVAEDLEAAARLGLRAGVDLDDVDGSAYRTLVKQVREGRVPEALVDRAAERILATKFRLGLFDEPYVDPDRAARITNSPEHRELALKTAERAVVLLKNEGMLLPLDLEKLRTIAVIGPNAADLHLGGYSRDPLHGVSMLAGIQERAGSKAKVVYAEGCRITEGEGRRGWRGWYDDPKLPEPNEDRKRLEEAVAIARKADVAIVVVGENESTNREAWNAGHPGDRDSLDLLGLQDELIKAIVETGTPTVVFLIGGRPLSITYAVEHVPAILVGWYLGQETGTAAARILFGDVNPGGRLPITFPRSVGQIPAYYYRRSSNQMPYLFASRKPLFPFGWGLSYTTFRYGNLRVESPTIGIAGETTVSVDITNTGTRPGDEVAQLYIHQRLASVTRPVMQLKGFERVSLKPGETRSVRFTVGPDQLRLLNRDMQWVVEPGVFDLMVGPSSIETTNVSLSVTAGGTGAER
jgi:beta-glucosidase